MPAWDEEKPSRQKRRQKRGWQRKPKKLLDRALRPWQSLSPVLNTPHKAVAAPDSLSGIFTPIVSFLAGSGQSIQQPSGESCQRSLCRVEVPATLSWGGALNEHKGGHHG